MKNFILAVAGVLWVVGLIMAGSETQGFGNQVILSTAGTMLFVVSTIFLAWFFSNNKDL